MNQSEVTFADYSEALKWIHDRAQSYKSLNDFYTSNEYKSIYPLIKQMYDVEQSTFEKKALSELQKSGLKIGDRVTYDYVSSFFNVKSYTGVIVLRSGIPYVQLDAGQTTMSGKKSVRWHKGFIKR